ncbi:MAG TPA: hypothetical protein VNL94_06020 [Candidatus Binatia bacterium]|nr:hypothetical protein [Candidatus Binatia bacterium]
MRGFLGFTVLLLAALAVAALVLVPMIVRPMVVDAVHDASPFGDQPIDVAVDIDPLRLLQGRIERIRVTGSNLEVEGAIISNLDLTLLDVSTGGKQSFGELTGRLTDVVLPFVQLEPLVIPTVELSGTDGDIDALARFDLRGGLSLVGNAFAESGIAVESLELIDGGISFGLFGQRVAVPLGVDQGALVIPEVMGGPLVIVEPAPDDQWEITDVRVTPSGMDVRVSLRPGGATG